MNWQKFLMSDADTDVMVEKMFGRDLCKWAKEFALTSGLKGFYIAGNVGDCLHGYKLCYNRNTFLTQH